MLFGKPRSSLLHSDVRCTTYDPQVVRSPKPDDKCLNAVEGWYDESSSYVFGTARPFKDNANASVRRFIQLVRNSLRTLTRAPSAVSGCLLGGKVRDAAAVDPGRGAFFWATCVIWHKLISARSVVSFP